MTISRTIISTRIDCTDYSQATLTIINLAKAAIASYVVAANVHVVMSAYGNKSYQTIINQALLVTPDGMPLVWALKLLGRGEATRVYGPDLMLTICQQAMGENLGIYLYGGTEDCLIKLKVNLIKRFPQLNIVGTDAPPFRPLEPEEERMALRKIKQSGARILFVGLGCPKQEIWMANHYQKLDLVMIGVGAAFNFHSGLVSQAPRWLMAMGLEWLYRLLMEPGRLWRRYLVNNPAFLILFTWQWLTKKSTL
ncbi:MULTISPECIES: WecB/TagA/CpsF family glycosyltransferase [unclassified Synechocystis]|uniref:WecB/TagA/CpsF family glycosyltransferase n=1 Tax=unclassified Synechocystis TaxID=2640012 RepID=UPI000401BF0D|nr:MULTISPECIES: WecB/TagA/CpsF family glycosyltransferase [unclassified Synechocystis]AIE74347.1 putative UDP-N-acetyl-D-mannosaminuronic acid transferase [Synechocystis sp. PCC 6714]MCT0254873.1 WecB/TagA/CpsF family glycosyltransferase [Synechocystis sp. CS-94]